MTGIKVWYVAEDNLKEVSDATGIPLEKLRHQFEEAREQNHLMRIAIEYVDKEQLWE